MMYSYPWMTGACFGFQFDDVPVYDEEQNDLVMMNAIFLYLGILEIQILWNKKELDK